MFAHFRNIETTDFMSQGKEDNSYIGNPSIVDNVPQKKTEGEKKATTTMRPTCSVDRGWLGTDILQRPNSAAPLYFVSRGIKRGTYYW